MSNVFAILLGTVLANNLVFAHLLGLEALQAAPRQSLRDVAATGIATALALTLSAGLGWTIDHAVLQPLALGFLRPPTLILVTAVSIGLVGVVLVRTNAVVRELWQRQRRLITANSAVLGVALLASRDLASLPTALLFGASAGVAFTFVALLYAALRERLIDSEIPAPFRGAPIELLTASLMALAFAGLAGLERHA